MPYVNGVWISDEVARERRRAGQRAVARQKAKNAKNTKLRRQAQGNPMPGDSGYGTGPDIRRRSAPGSTSSKVRVNPTTGRVTQPRYRPRPSPTRATDPRFRGLDAARAARRAQTPEQIELARRLRSAYMSRPGEELLGGRLERISAQADPLINFTETVTRPLTTPASVAAALIEGDIANAAKQLVSASYWGDYKFPSEVLTERGWLPDTPMGRLLGVGVDVAPSFALPGVKGAGSAAGRQAARQVSRGQRLPRTTTERVPHQDQAARLPGTPAPRQQRAARLSPQRGPDIVTNPNAPVVPMRPRPGGQASRGGRARPGSDVPRRSAGQLPYAPTPRLQGALDEFRDAVGYYERLTQRQPTRLQAARSGQRLGRAEAALTAAERATIERIRSTPPRLTSTQRAQIEARLPGGAVRAGARPASLMGKRGPDLPTPKAKPREKMPPAVKPKDVPYTPIQAARAELDAARQAVRTAVNAKGPAPAALAEVKARVAKARDLVQRATARGANVRGYQKNLEIQVKRLERVIADNPTPSRSQLVSLGRQLESAIRRVNIAEAGVRRQIAEGRSNVRTLGRPTPGKPTARQRRAAEPRRGRSEFDQRPRTVTELRRSSSTPLEGRRLPGLRIKVNQARGKMDATVRPVPTEKQIGKAGQRLAKAEAKLRKAEKALYKKRPQRKGKPTEPTARQRDIYRDTFTGSREREWIDANMEYEIAFREAVASAPIGVNITLPFRFNKKGLTIPIVTGSAAAKVRAAFTNGPLGEALAGYRTWLVSRYGPNEVVRQGAVAADDVVRYQSGRSARFIRDETRRARLSEDDLILASHWLEGTAKGVVPVRVQNYATKMAQLTERNLDEFIQAGGKVKRFGKKLEGGLDRQYVYHLLPRGEWDDFAVSSLAKRQMLYGKRPGFTKRREVMTIEDLKNAGFHPVERLDELTFARAMAHHRALAEMELTRSIERRFGRPAKDAPDDWQTIPSQFTDSEIVVPKDVAQSLRNVIAARLAIPGNKVAKHAQSLNQRWKEWALLTLGHDIRNQLGDSALQFQRTMNPVAPLMSLTFGAKTLSGRGKVGGKSDLTSAQAKRIAETGGMRDTGLLGGDVLSDVASVEAQGRGVVRRAGASRPIGAVHRGVRRARTMREGVNKTGIFTRELRKGEGAVHATRVAKETIYDYADVGKAVNWARRSPVGAPFATWTAKNLPAQIRMAIQQPGQLSAALTAIESLREQTGGWPRFLTPDWMRERVPVPIPGYGNTAFDLPISSLNLIPTSRPGKESFMETVRAWQSQLGPLMQAPIAVTGNDPLTGEKFRGQRPASRVEQFLQMFPVTAFFLGSQGDKVLARDSRGVQGAVPAAKDDFFSWVFRQFTPGLSTAGRVAGTPGRSTMDTIRGPVLGHTTTPFFDRAKVESLQRSLAYEYRQKVGDFNRRMKANAPDWKKGDPIPKHLRGDYQEILRIVAQGEWIKAALTSIPAGRR